MNKNCRTKFASGHKVPVTSRECCLGEKQMPEIPIIVYPLDTKWLRNVCGKHSGIGHSECRDVPSQNRRGWVQAQQKSANYNVSGVKFISLDKNTIPQNLLSGLDKVGTWRITYTREIEVWEMEILVSHTVTGQKKRNNSLQKCPSKKGRKK